VLLRAKLVVLAGLVLGLGLSIQAMSTPAVADDQSEVVAEVQGQRFSEADLEQKQAAKLLAARYQYYLAQRKAVEELLDNYLLMKEAEKQKVTVDELLQRQIISKLKDPTDDQLRVYYEGLNTEQPYESVRGQIVDQIKHLRAVKARSAYLKKLREQNKAKVLLKPPKADVSVANAPVRGSAESPVLLIEFADYECPYCKQIEPDIQRLNKEFQGKLKFAFRDFPLPMHRQAQKAAEAAHCAEAQGQFWEFHDSLFAGDVSRLGEADLKSRAGVLKLDQKRFDQCLESGEQAARIRQDLAAGQALGLTGTPSFFVNGRFVSGAVGYDTLHDLVERELTSDHPSVGSARSSNPGSGL
jgi:protein-disulfide isomerase